MRFKNEKTNKRVAIALFAIAVVILAGFVIKLMVPEKKDDNPYQYSISDSSQNAEDELEQSEEIYIEQQEMYETSPKI